MLAHPSSQDRHLPAGHIADLCPACGSCRACTIERVEYRVTITFIPAMPWSLRHHQATCGTCRTQWFVKPEDFLSISEAPLDIDPLITATNPGLRSIQSRLESCTGVNTQCRPTPTERQAWLVECLRNTGRLLAPKGVADYIAFGFIATFLFFIGHLLFVMPIFLTVKAIDPSLAIRWTHAGPAATLIEWTVWTIVFALATRLVIQRRRRKLYAAARNAISRISPTAEEVLAAASEAKDTKLPIARYLSTSALARRLTPI